MKNTDRIITLALLSSVLLICFFLQIVWSDDTDGNKTKVKSDKSKYLQAYTGADADKTGSSQCIVCHDNVIPDSPLSHIAILDKNLKGKYYGYGCEGCHGAGGNHNGDLTGILMLTKMKHTESIAQCSLCHSSLRTYDLRNYKLSEHYYEEFSCLKCHGGHSGRKMFLNQDEESLCTSCHMRERAQFNLRSHHPIDGNIMKCTSCHNAMSGEFDHQLHKDGDMLCFECHGDKQGPFIYQMDIGTDVGGEGCLSCHVAHGSNTDTLLKYPTRLCLRCHSEMGSQHHFSGKCWMSGCHADIHGSNSNPLFISNN